MGLQITILLADIIYVEILQSTVPVFDSYGNTPLILTFFIVSIILNCICLLISANTLYLYHCPDYEVRNFSRTEARIGCPRNVKSGQRKQHIITVFTFSIIIRILRELRANLLQFLPKIEKTSRGNPKQGSVQEQLSFSPNLLADSGILTSQKIQNQLQKLENKLLIWKISIKVGCPSELISARGSMSHLLSGKVFAG